MTRVAQYDGRGQSDKRQGSGAGARRGGPARRSRAGTPPPVARPGQVWQRRTAGIRTLSTAPAPTGQPLNGMRRMGSVLRRCQQCVDPRKVTRAEAAAWELAVHSIRGLPRNLSAIYQPQASPTPFHPGWRPAALPHAGESERVCVLCEHHPLSWETSTRSVGRMWLFPGRPAWIQRRARRSMNRLPREGQNEPPD